MGTVKGTKRNYPEKDQDILFVDTPTLNVKKVLGEILVPVYRAVISDFVVNDVFKDPNDLFKHVGIKVWTGISKTIFWNPFAEVWNREPGMDTYQVLV